MGTGCFIESASRYEPDATDPSSVDDQKNKEIATLDANPVHHLCPYEITKCPSSCTIKLLLKHQTGSQNDPQTAQMLTNVFEQRNYSITKLIDDLHHLKYEHDVEDDDANFDVIYDFFNDGTAGKVCDINECRIIERHYRDRGKREIMEELETEDVLLLDMMAMIHFYFLHSFDTDRLTKEERHRVNLEVTDSKQKEQNSDDDALEDDTIRTDVISSILTEKRGNVRFGRDFRRFIVDDDKGSDMKTEGRDVIDFTALSLVIGVVVDVLRDTLLEIPFAEIFDDLIDAVYAENVDENNIWYRFGSTDEQKSKICCKALYGYFKSTQLSSSNFVKISQQIVERKRLQIDVKPFEEVVRTNGFDGRMFDKADAEHYQNMGTFAKRFKGIPGCKAQHLRQLYGALRKWNYVEVKKEETKEIEVEVEAEPVPETNLEHPDVYAIGKRFIFWESQRRHKDYVAAKYGNMKEEVLQSPLLSAYFPGVHVWTVLVASVGAMIQTQTALKINSNGLDKYIYKMEKGEPFDEQHLIALKLYTDFTELCASICSILRRGVVEQISEIANWARILTETVQCYGSSCKNRKHTYYRGVNRTFMFMTIVSRFNLPQSTTIKVENSCAF